MPVITFSRQYPRGHPKAGQPTHFVRSIWEGLDILNIPTFIDPPLEEDAKDFYDKISYTPKWHTIRANRKDGKRWTPGDTFSPRVWESKAYASKQIIIAPNIEIKKVWDFHITESAYLLYNKELNLSELAEVAMNDGLSVQDFEDWFACHPKKKGEIFKGQIICWNEAIEY